MSRSDDHTRPDAGSRGTPRALRAVAAQDRSARVIAVTSGKGGVGKSVVSANMALSLARAGRRVLLVDADLALANLDLVLGVETRGSLHDVIEGQLPLDHVLVRCSERLALLPACSGREEVADITPEQQSLIFSAIDALESDFDTVVIDTGAGIGSNATRFAAAAQQVVVVITPDPTSLADAYAMIKVLSTRGVERVHVVVNMASTARQAQAALQRLEALVDRFLEVLLVPVGFVYQDDAVIQSVRACQPVVTRFPQAPVARAFQAISARLLEEPQRSPGQGGPMIFWKRLLGVPGLSGSAHSFNEGLEA